MGGVIDTLFGGSKNSSTSKSFNQAFPFLQGALSPMVSGGVNAFNMAGSALGLGGDTAGAASSLDNYMNNIGTKYLMDTMTRGVSGSQAAKGIYNSGSTLKAMQDRAGNIAQTGYGNWLNNIMGLSQQGLGAAGVIGGAGGVSEGTSKGSSKGGILPALFG